MLVRKIFWWFPPPSVDNIFWEKFVEVGQNWIWKVGQNKKTPPPNFDVFATSPIAVNSPVFMPVPVDIQEIYCTLKLKIFLIQVPTAFETF